MLSFHLTKCLQPGSGENKAGTQVITLQTVIQVCALNLDEQLEKKIVALHDLSLETLLIVVCGIHLVSTYWNSSPCVYDTVSDKHFYFCNLDCTLTFLKYIFQNKELKS